MAKCKDEIQNKKQIIIFCVLGSHPHNGKVEIRIKFICNPERSMLFHTMHRWIEVDNHKLWTFVISLESDLKNKDKHDIIGTSPIERLVQISQLLDTKNFHSFYYLTCTLSTDFQDSKSIPR